MKVIGHGVLCPYQYRVRALQSVALHHELIGKLVVKLYKYVPPYQFLDVLLGVVARHTSDLIREITVLMHRIVLKLQKIARV